MIAIKEMMKRGMIVDIDHMSNKSAEATLAMAEGFHYPVVSGHTGIRGQGGSNAENSRTRPQLERIAKLHGMFGLGSDGAHAWQWARLYQTRHDRHGLPQCRPAQGELRERRRLLRHGPERPGERPASPAAAIA